MSMNLASRNYQEKRSFIRMKVETPIDIYIDEEHRVSGICHNLSGGGMCVSLTEPLALGTQVHAVVSSNHGHHPMLKALVKVSRVDSKPHLASEPCQMGMQIVQLLEEIEPT